MPTYDYVCPQNGQEVSVFHAMSTRVATWGELCDLASVDVGETPPHSPVKRMIGTGFVLPQSSGQTSGGEDGCCSGHGCSC